MKSHDVDRRRRLTHKEFVREYLEPLKPVVLADAIDHWPAFGKWSIDFFREAYGGRTVRVDGRDLVMRDLLDHIDRSRKEDPAPYLRNLLIEEWAPDLLPDIQPMPGCTTPNWLSSRLFKDGRAVSAIELYIGGAGAAFPVLHYDGMHTHAYLMQLQGAKEYVIYAPDQTGYLYPRDGIERNKSMIVDIESPDLQRFPRFASATPFRTLLHAGETLFVPSGWWHTARILEPSITVSINTANASNWQAFCDDYLESVGRHQPKWRTLATSAYLAVFHFLEAVIAAL